MSWAFTATVGVSFNEAARGRFCRGGLPRVEPMRCPPSFGCQRGNYPDVQDKGYLIGRPLSIASIGEISSPPPWSARPPNPHAPCPPSPLHRLRPSESLFF